MNLNRDEKYYDKFRDKMLKKIMEKQQSEVTRRKCQKKNYKTKTK